MKILNIGTSLGGGAGIAMKRISDAQRQMGMDVEIWALGHSKDFALETGTKIISRSIIERSASSSVTLIQSKFVQRDNRLITSLGNDIIKSNKLFKQMEVFDVLSFHSIYNLTQLKTILEISKVKRTLITLHDERMFTGGCHYSFNCNGFQTTCSKCPQVHRLFQKLPMLELEKAKNQVFAHPNFKEITLISPSNWLAKKALSSPHMSNHNIEVIPNPVPSMNKIEGRTKNIEPKIKRIAFVSENINNPYKGFNILIKALNTLFGKFDFEFTVIGRGDIRGLNPNIPCSQTYASNDFERNLVYLNQDLIVVPSIQDNFPSVATESLMSGTPVIGTDAGGIPEILSGFGMPIVSAGKIEELARAIQSMPVRYDRESISSKASQRFSYNEVGKQYSRLLNHLI